MKETDIGIRWIDRRDILTVLLLLILSLPISFLASIIPDVRNYYLRYDVTPIAIFDRFFSLFVTELFFRGFLLFVLSRRFGRWSIILQDVPYAILHIGKPILEIPYSATVGLIFGSINYRSKSSYRVSYSMR